MRLYGHWGTEPDLQSLQFACGWCGAKVASTQGWDLYDPRDREFAAIRICHLCNYPTFLTFNHIIPSPPRGNHVEGLPDDVGQLYDEARRSATNGAPTASVLTLRKLLMNIAVSQGADAGSTFRGYVDFLLDNGFAPPGGREWVDHIRDRGNEANHEIDLMSLSDADELLAFAEMLLRWVYELPARARAPGKELHVMDRRKLTWMKFRSERGPGLVQSRLGNATAAETLDTCEGSPPADSVRTRAPAE